MTKKKQLFWQNLYLFFNMIFFQVDTLKINDLPTLWCLSCYMIRQGLQNSHRFPIRPFHLMKISSSLERDKSRCGTDLENTVDREAIRSVIYWFLTSFLLICELVYCLAKRPIFSLTNEVIFLWFLFSINSVIVFVRFGAVPLGPTHCFACCFDYSV